MIIQCKDFKGTVSILVVVSLLLRLFHEKFLRFQPSVTKGLRAAQWVLRKWARPFCVDFC